MENQKMFQSTNQFLCQQSVVMVASCALTSIEEARLMEDAWANRELGCTVHRKC